MVVLTPPPSVIMTQVNHLVHQVGGSLSSILHRFDESEFAITQFEGLRMDSSFEIVVDEDGQITPNSILENPLVVQYKQGGSSSSSECEINVAAGGGLDDPHLNSKRSRKKKGSGGGFIPGMVLSLGNRRKGAPQRAPFS